MGAGNNNCKFCSSRVCGYINKPPVSDKKYCVIFNAAKPIPESASDVERTYIKINRAYVAKFEPSKVKGMSQYEMKQKLGWNEADSAAVVNPVISNRTAFDAWLAKNEINMHRVAMIVSPSSPSVAEEGGLLAPEMASPLRAMRATNANMRSPSSAAIPSRRPSVHAPMVIAPAPQAGLSYLFQRPSMQALLELTGLLLRRLRNIDRSSFLNLVIGLLVVQRHGSALVSYLLPSKEHVRAALIRALRRLAKLGVSAGAHLAVVSSTTSRLLPSP